MIRRSFLHLALLLALCSYAVPSASAEVSVKDWEPKAAKTTKADKKGKKAAKEDKEDKKAKKETRAKGAVGEYLQGVDDAMLWVNEKPAYDADFYIYLTTASWCGPCNMEMPHVVEHYKKMRELGNVELIVVSGDREANAAKGFMEKYGATFAVYDRAMARQLPGFTPPNGIPNAIIVDKDGNVIRQGHGVIINQWEELTVNNPDYAGKISAHKSKGAAAKRGKEKKDSKASKSPKKAHRR